MQYEESRLFSNTDTEAFRKWFGDSQVVDYDGKPLVVYHGTDADIKIFDGDKTIDDAFYFTDNELASTGYGSNAIPVFLKIENPLVLDYDGDSDSTLHKEIPLAKENGHDGIIAQNTHDGVEIINQYIAFYPTQIKSIYNTGTWDGSNPDIGY